MSASKALRLDDTWIYLEQAKFEGLTFKCRAYTDRGAPDTCNADTPFMLEYSNGGDSAAFCRDHIPVAYEAAKLLFGYVQVYHHTSMLVPKWAMMPVAPDALPNPDMTCFRSSNCNQPDGHLGDCVLEYSGDPPLETAHSCEAHCTLDHYEEGFEEDDK